MTSKNNTPQTSNQDLNPTIDWATAVEVAKQEAVSNADFMQIGKLAAQITEVEIGGSIRYQGPDGKFIPKSVVKDLENVASGRRSKLDRMTTAEMDELRSGISSREGIDLPEVAAIRGDLEEKLGIELIRRTEEEFTIQDAKRSIADKKAAIEQKEFERFAQEQLRVEMQRRGIKSVPPKWQLDSFADGTLKDKNYPGILINVERFFEAQQAANQAAAARMDVINSNGGIRNIKQIRQKEQKIQDIESEIQANHTKYQEDLKALNAAKAAAKLDTPAKTKANKAEDNAIKKDQAKDASAEDEPATELFKNIPTSTKEPIIRHPLEKAKYSALIAKEDDLKRALSSLEANQALSAAQKDKLSDTLAEEHKKLRAEYDELVSSIAPRPEGYRQEIWESFSLRDMQAETVRLKAAFKAEQQSIERQGAYELSSWINGGTREEQELQRAKEAAEQEKVARRARISTYLANGGMNPDILNSDLIKPEEVKRVATKYMAVATPKESTIADNKEQEDVVDKPESEVSQNPVPAQPLFTNFTNGAVLNREDRESARKAIRQRATTAGSVNAGKNRAVPANFREEGANSGEQSDQPSPDDKQPGVLKRAVRRVFDGRKVMDKYRRPALGKNTAAVRSVDPRQVYDISAAELSDSELRAAILNAEDSVRRKQQLIGSEEFKAQSTGQNFPTLIGLEKEQSRLNAYRTVAQRRGVEV